MNNWLVFMFCVCSVSIWQGKDDVTKNDPDLYFNRSMVCLYMYMYVILTITCIRVSPNSTRDEVFPIYISEN